MPAKKKGIVRNPGNASETAEDNGKQRGPNLAATARGRAIQRMIEDNTEQWAQYLREEREKVGLGAEPGRKTRIQTFAEKMIAAGVDPGEVQAAMVEAGFKGK